MLSELAANGKIAVRSGWGFALTPALRDFFESGDTEEIEAVAFDHAAEASLRLLATGEQQRFPHRRVVISIDVADTAAKPEPDYGESVVKLDPPSFELAQVAAIHVDLAEAEAATAKAVAAIDAADLGDADADLIVGDAQDNFMAWYDPTELNALVELL